MLRESNPVLLSDLTSRRDSHYQAAPLHDTTEEDSRPAKARGLSRKLSYL